MKRLFGNVVATAVVFCGGAMTPETTFAQTAAAAGISGADTAWVLVSAALVLAMTVPGLAL